MIGCMGCPVKCNLPCSRSTACPNPVSLFVARWPLTRFACFREALPSTSFRGHAQDQRIVSGGEHARVWRLRRAIAYTLKLLGGAPVICAAIGDDGASIATAWRALASGSTRCAVPGLFTANCHITTDLDDNQITSFHAGAMFQSQVNDDCGGQHCAGHRGTGWARRHVQACAWLCVEADPFHLTPVRRCQRSRATRLPSWIGMADYLSVNDYEAEMIAQKTGRAIESSSRQD